MKELDDCIVDVEEIRPLPLGERFAAKVRYFYVETDEGRKKIEGMACFHGFSEAEAESKAIEHVKGWLDKNDV